MENDWPYVHNDVSTTPKKLVWTFVHTLIIFRCGTRGIEHCKLLHSAIPAQVFRA
jgi:hypothetical protein